MLSRLSARNVPEKEWRRQPQPSPGKNGALAGQDQVSESWERILDKLSDFRRLEDDWDGQGARALSAELLDSASALAALFRERGLGAPSAVAPGPAGTVLFVWHEQDGTYCEVEVERPFYAEVMLVEAGQKPRHWVLPDGA